MLPSLQYVAISMKPSLNEHAAFWIAGYQETRSTDALQTCKVPVLLGGEVLPPGVKVLLIFREYIMAD